MKIATINLNGVRSAFSKGIEDWVSEHNPDIIAVQETKAQTELLKPEEHLLDGYHASFSSAIKKGYSGVGLYAKKPPIKIHKKCGLDWADDEGRYIAYEYANLMVISLYLPSGSSGEHRQLLKYNMLDHFYEHHLKQYLNLGKPVIICGDWNIAHKIIDIKNAKSNQNNSGFLKEERAWMDSVMSLGYIDAFRHKCLDKDQYTWWSFRGKAREKNVGWRIDYQITTPCLIEKIQKVSIFPTPLYSDHAPLLVEYNYNYE
jgi:exodeoxyribonuclease-3